MYCAVEAYFVCKRNIAVILGVLLRNPMKAELVLD